MVLSSVANWTPVVLTELASRSTSTSMGRETPPFAELPMAERIVSTPGRGLVSELSLAVTL